MSTLALCVDDPVFGGHKYFDPEDLQGAEAYMLDLIERIKADPSPAIADVWKEVAMLEITANTKRDNCRIQWRAEDLVEEEEAQE